MEHRVRLPQEEEGAYGGVHRADAKNKKSFSEDRKTAVRLPAAIAAGAAGTVSGKAT